MSTKHYGLVTPEIKDLFMKHGIDPVQHDQLIRDLMHYVYDRMDDAVDEVVGRDTL